MSLAEHVTSYVAFKRATGLSFREPEQLLGSFAAHAESRGNRFVRAATAIDWASQVPSPRRQRDRLQLVCGLAAYLHAADERHEVPHLDALGRAHYHRPPPRLLSLPHDPPDHGCGAGTAARRLDHAALVGENVLLLQDPSAPRSRPIPVLYEGRAAGTATLLDTYANTRVKRARTPHGPDQARDPAPEPPPSPIRLRDLRPATPETD